MQQTRDLWAGWEYFEMGQGGAWKDVILHGQLRGNPLRTPLTSRANHGAVRDTTVDYLDCKGQV